MTFAVSFREGKFRNDHIRVQFGLGQNECLVIMGGMYIQDAPTKIMISL